MAQTIGKQQQLNIELGEREAEGIYSNLALISHSPAEFVIDFTRIVPGVPKSKVYARIIMTPQHAKSLLRALKENIGKYETQFGEIKVIHEQNQGGRQIGFVSPQTGKDAEQP
ncbi:DUF3467 domain-containing protein [candidate division KSB1 bacterium]|nr:DUF3467 domain-containing protein [candidate division KSB1 bacterium]